jgi:diadenosine tetraphosphate (Ap4A) HIT family hydrolase
VNKLYEDEASVRILDSNPLCDGHSLVLQKAHFPSLEVTPPQVAAAMRAAVPLISCVEATHSEYAEAAFERCAGSEDSSTHGPHQAHLQHSD